MVQSVNVPGVGQLDFPDGMSQQEMSSAIQKNFPQLSQQEAPPEKSWLSSATDAVGHQLGLTARAAINGAVALPAMASDAITGPINAGLDAVAGQGNGFRFQRAGDAVNKLMDAAGVSQPQNATERVVQDAASAGFGAGGMVGAGKLLANSAGPVASAVGDALSAGPGLQAVSGASGAGASGVVREKGGGAGAQALAGLAGALAPVGIAIARNSAGGTRQLAASAQKASEAGYVIPPVELNPSAITEVASGVGGKIKTAQVASQRNQQVTNQLVKQSLGLPEEAELTKDALNTIRRNAAEDYQAVAEAGTFTPSAKYDSAIDAAVAPYVNQAKSFPNRKIPALVDDIQALKSPQIDSKDAIDAIRSMRNEADAAYRSGDAMAGKAYKNAATALEGAIDEHLVNVGAPADLLQGYRDARQTIAQTYTIEKALNSTTGNVDAQKLAAALKKGAPLSDELKTIAEVAQAFPKATQLLKEAPGNVSVLDVAMAGAKATMKNPLPLLSLGGRPIARSVLLSDTVQRLAVSRAGPNSTNFAAGAPSALVAEAARLGINRPNDPRLIPMSKRQQVTPRIELNGIAAPDDKGARIASAKTVDDAVAAAMTPSASEARRAERSERLAEEFARARRR